MPQARSGAAYEGAMVRPIVGSQITTGNYPIVGLTKSPQGNAGRLQTHGSNCFLTGESQLAFDFAEQAGRNGTQRNIEMARRWIAASQVHRLLLEKKKGRLLAPSPQSRNLTVCRAFRRLPGSCAAATTLTQSAQSLRCAAPPDVAALQDHATPTRTSFA